MRPDLVLHTLQEIEKHQSIRWVYLSTNGSTLDKTLLFELQKFRKLILTISIDGLPENHLKMRRSLSKDLNSYENIISVLDILLDMPRVVVTQTIPPATAKFAYENYMHLRSLGFWRFNFLPGYYLPWKEESLLLLREGFTKISQDIIKNWKADRPLYVRNLFTWAPTIFFNTGMIVDSDRRIHPSNIGLSGQLDHILNQTAVGNLDHPPSIVELEEAAKRIPHLIARHVKDHILQATQRADQELTRLCTNLWPYYKEKKQLKQQKITLQR